MLCCCTHLAVDPRAAAAGGPGRGPVAITGPQGAKVSAALGPPPLQVLLWARLPLALADVVAAGDAEDAPPAPRSTLEVLGRAGRSPAPARPRSARRSTPRGSTIGSPGPAAPRPASRTSRAARAPAGCPGGCGSCGPPPGSSAARQGTSSFTAASGQRAPGLRRRRRRAVPPAPGHVVALAAGRNGPRRPRHRAKAHETLDCSLRLLRRGERLGQVGDQVAGSPRCPPTGAPGCRGCRSPRAARCVSS